MSRLTGSVLQALVISMPMGIPLFWAADWIGGAAGDVFGFSALVMPGPALIASGAGKAKASATRVFF